MDSQAIVSSSMCSFIVPCTISPVFVDLVLQTGTVQIVHWAWVTDKSWQAYCSLEPAVMSAKQKPITWTYFSWSTQRNNFSTVLIAPAIRTIQILCKLICAWEISKYFKSEIWKLISAIKKPLNTTHMHTLCQDTAVRPGAALQPAHHQVSHRLTGLKGSLALQYFF